MQRLNLLPVGEAARSHFNVVELALFFLQDFPQARFACVDDFRREDPRQQGSVSELGLQSTTPDCAAQ